jgi:nicotinamidase-related amidase
MKFFRLCCLFLLLGCSGSGNTNTAVTPSPAYAEEKLISLKVRHIHWSADPERYDTEMDCAYSYETLSLLPSKAAFILIDVWDRSYNDGLSERIDRNVREKLVPALEAAQAYGLTIIHSPHLEGSTLGYKIHPLASPRDGEFIVDGPQEQEMLLSILKGRGITTIIYVGYASNMCLLNRPTGFQEMKKQGFEIILLRDASLAVELPRVFSLGLVHEVMLVIYESSGYSATVEDFLKG